MIRVSNCDTQRICKDRRGFSEFDAVLFHILTILLRIPVEFHKYSLIVIAVPGGG